MQVLPFVSNPKDLDPSYMMDLDFTASYNRRNAVHLRINMPTPGPEAIKHFHAQAS